MSKHGGVIVPLVCKELSPGLLEALILGHAFHNRSRLWKDEFLS